ncbi:MAG TPA: RpiB/LacA/LacB family sugar-phosphate isomerase, partial [Bacteroidia bacterium]|nr:RpiB/LacA/LacB family sugar-phosphate isomerase [Bacteroidia bacterium]
MKIAIGGDHAGYELKAKLIARLKSQGHEVTDFGTGGPESVDYPDYVHPLAKAAVGKDADFGILVCGSGNGV